MARLDPKKPRRAAQERARIQDEAEDMGVSVRLGSACPERTAMRRFGRAVAKGKQHETKD